MKFCLGSDIHGNIGSLKHFLKISKSAKCDNLLLAGDLASWQDNTSIFEVFNELNISGIPTIAVLGNSDYENYLELAKDYSQIKILHGNSMVINNINIIGVSGIPETNEHGSYFSIPESKILKLFVNAINEIEKRKFLISISHVPPLNILDMNRYGEHIGSRAIKTFIERYKPDLHLCGHVHESQGIVRIGKTIVVNAGMLKKNGSVYIAEIDENIEIKMIDEFH